MNNDGWAEGLAAEMWPDGYPALAEYLALVRRDYPRREFIGPVLAAALISLVEDAERRNEWAVGAPSPFCTKRQAEDRLIEDLRLGRRQAEGRIGPNSEFLPIPNSAWRHAIVSADGQYFNLCDLQTKEVRFYDVWLRSPGQLIMLGVERGSLPPHASKSAREHERAAHAAAAVVRKKNCSVSAAIRSVRHMVEAGNRTDDSVDRAIRNCFELMYTGHGKPITN